METTTPTTASLLQIPVPPPFLDHPGKPLLRYEQWHEEFVRFIEMSEEANGESISDRLKDGYLVSYLGIEERRILSADKTFKIAESGSHFFFIKKVKS